MRDNRACAAGAPDSVSAQPHRTSVNGGGEKCVAYARSARHAHGVLSRGAKTPTSNRADALESDDAGAMRLCRRAARPAHCAPGVQFAPCVTARTADRRDRPIPPRRLKRLGGGGERRCETAGQRSVRFGCAHGPCGLRSGCALKIQVGRGAASGSVDLFDSRAAAAGDVFVDGGAGEAP